MLRQHPLLLSLLVATCCYLSTLSASAAEPFELTYRAEISPETGMAEVSVELEGQALPKRLVLHFDDERHSDIRSDDPLERNGDDIVWKPAGDRASLHYQFKINEQKTSGSFDSRITEDWAILRSDKLIPPISATMDKGVRSKAYLQLELPEEWSAALPYQEVGEARFAIKDPGRRFKRPKGWMILGHIGSRQDIIAGVNTKVAAPLGENIRRQDTLAFLNWNLPYIKEVFPGFPDYLLVVSAGNPMWRGGLSGTRSLFMHADRPLISGNRTSSLIHELVHVATGIRGDKQSDWIVEGLAEFYALEILRRSGGISQRRFDEAMAGLSKWGREAPTLLVKRSSGPVTARAATVMLEVDREIRAATDNQASIDDVARGLAKKRGRVSLARFRELAEKVAGKPLESLRLENLNGEDSR